MTKRFFRSAVAVLALAAAACTPRERTLVLLSTNDIHAQIDRFPQLAAAVEACRDTTDNVVLIDAGDRWTGNPYVDRTPTPGMPIIRLMNRLGYDVATLGNHEFDHGQAFLGRMIDSMEFAVVCANVRSDTCTFPQLPPYTIVERGGIRIGLVGVVTNYEGPGHPAGHASSFVGLEFPDPQEMAMRYGEELRPKVDVLVLVSHMGDDRDEEFLLKAAHSADGGGNNVDGCAVSENRAVDRGEHVDGSAASENRAAGGGDKGAGCAASAGGAPLYDVVIGGHTHEVRNSVVGGTLLTQTGKNLNNVGVTVIRMRGRKIVDCTFRLVDVSAYDAAEPYAGEVVAYNADPELNRPAGRFTRGAGKLGIAGWMARSVAAATKSDVGFYHRGGVRVDTIPAGDVSRAQIYALEPFNSTVAVSRMTPEALRRIIMAKYNDTCNLKEAHRIDLIATTPYTIVTDADDRAIDVLFPQLQEGRIYRMAYNDYVFKNYAEIDRSAGSLLEGMLVNELLLNELSIGRPVTVDNTPLQRISVRR